MQISEKREKKQNWLISGYQEVDTGKVALLGTIGPKY